MSLFQCQNCGCAENTALSCQGFKWGFEQYFSWEGLVHLKGKELCSACGPCKHEDGSLTEYGKWHGEFKRVFLPLGEFKTNDVGNLEHIATGSEDYLQFEIIGGLE